MRRGVPIKVTPYRGMYIYEWPYYVFTVLNQTIKRSGSVEEAQGKIDRRLDGPTRKRSI